MAAPEDPALPQDLGLPQDLTFVDLETTGGNAAYHRITEIAIVRIRRGEVIEEWSSLVNPECEIPAYIQNFTGITNEMVAAAPRFCDISNLVIEKLRCPAAQAAPVFVAHNARFDYAFLRAEFRRIGMQFSAKVLCTVKLSRRLFPQHARHNLDAVMERHALICSARHRALGDARVIGEFWLKLRRELPEAAVASAAQSLLGAMRLPRHLPEGLADELPEGPGVYRFYGVDDIPLYVHRAACLRLGVLGHFADARAAPGKRNLKDGVRRIDWVETAGELGASLRELAYVQLLRPIHNRQLDAGAGSVTIRMAEHSGHAEIRPIGAAEAADLDSCFGVFHSSKDARKALLDIAAARQLCLKVLGLEQSVGSCFALQMGKCKGACAGKEPLILHTLRAQMALSSLKLKPWPFPGRVALRERDSSGGADLHVLDHWTYLGTARAEDELAALAQKAAGVFDAHVYRILVRYFSNRPKLDWHDLSAHAHPLRAELGE